MRTRKNDITRLYIFDDLKELVIIDLLQKAKVIIADSERANFPVTQHFLNDSLFEQWKEDIEDGLSLNIKYEKWLASSFGVDQAIQFAKDLGMPLEDITCKSLSVEIIKFFINKIVFRIRKGVNEKNYEKMYKRIENFQTRTVEPYSAFNV